MRLLKWATVVLLPLFVLNACVGSGVSTKDEMLRVTNAAGPNTALFFWDISRRVEWERISFYQDKTSKGSIGPGQVLALPLRPGQNEFRVAWEEILDVPDQQRMNFEGKSSGPTYFVIRESSQFITYSRDFVPVSKETFLNAIRAAEL